MAGAASIAGAGAGDPVLISGSAGGSEEVSSSGESGIRTVSRQYGQARLLPHRFSETFSDLPHPGHGILKKIAIFNLGCGNLPGGTYLKRALAFFGHAHDS